MLIRHPYVSMSASLAILLAGLTLLAPWAMPARAAEQIPSYVDAAVRDPARPNADKQRDPARKPAETIAFVGIKAGDKVGELLPGDGYFTRIIAKVVGPKGHVYTFVPRGKMAEVAKSLASDNAYTNISTVETPLSEIKAPEALDVVWTSQNYHDVHNIAMEINKAVLAALKPGGIYLVLDHAAAPGASADDMKKLHRIDPALVKTEVTAAGFIFDAESNVLKRPDDNHTVVSHDPSIHDKTDQFIFKFHKPR
jgi:predicted methyltransferase